MSEGKLSIAIQGDGFVLKAHDAGRSVEMLFSKQQLFALSVALSELLSNYRKRSTPNEQAFLLDCISPAFSVAPDKVGVSVLLEADGFSPIKAAFPLALAIRLAREIMVAAEVSLDRMEYPPEL